MEEGTSTSRVLRSVDLVGIRQDAKPLEGGGEPERRLEGDEADAVGALPAPDQGGGQLQGPGGSQSMDGEDAQGPGPHLFGGLDLEGPSPQVVEHRAGLLKIGGGDPLPPLRGEQGLNALEGSAPPAGKFRVPLQERLDPVRGRLSHR